MRELISTCDNFPPFLCRLIARKKHGLKMMTHDDVAAAAGMSKRAVINISKKNSWRSLSMDTVERFSKACGVNLLSPSRHIKFMRKNMAFLKTANPKQRAMIKRLMGYRKVAPL